MAYFVDWLVPSKEPVYLIFIHIFRLLEGGHRGIVGKWIRWNKDSKVFFFVTVYLYFLYVTF